MADMPDRRVERYPRPGWYYQHSEGEPVGPFQCNPEGEPVGPSQCNPEGEPPRPGWYYQPPEGGPRRTRRN